MRSKVGYNVIRIGSVDVNRERNFILLISETTTPYIAVGVARWC